MNQIQPEPVAGLGAKALEAMLDVTGLGGRDRVQLAVTQLEAALADEAFLTSAGAGEVLAIEFAFEILSADPQ